MSIKKRFSISADIATGLRNSVQSASTNHGQLHYDMMSVDAIEPDPRNPRKLSFTPADVLNGRHPVDAKPEEWEALKELAESIKRVGVRNAIEVYKEGTKYRIISGERRFLASILAGQKYVPARISDKPDEFKLRYMQWVENINRQDLSLWEKYNNLLSISGSYQSVETVPFSAQVLTKLLGVSDAQAHRYFCLLSADKSVIDLVKQGRLTNLKVVQEIVCIKNKAEREKMIASLQASSENMTSLSRFKALQKKAPAKKQTITLGTLQHIDTAKVVLNLLLADDRLSPLRQRFSTLDLNSPKAINQAFKTLFDALQKELQREEVVNEVE